MMGSTPASHLDREYTHFLYTRSRQIAALCPLLKKKLIVMGLVEPEICDENLHECVVMTCSVGIIRITQLVAG